MENIIEIAADWFEKYLADGNTIDDWCRDSKNVESGRSKFLSDMKRSEYEIGQYLFDGRQAFIHDGYVDADGYGVVIGYYENELRKKSGYGNWQKTGNIRPATEIEIENLLCDIMSHDKRIKCFSE